MTFFVPKKTAAGSFTLFKFIAYKNYIFVNFADSKRLVPHEAIDNIVFFSIVLLRHCS